MNRHLEAARQWIAEYRGWRDYEGVPFAGEKTLAALLERTEREAVESSAMIAQDYESLGGPMGFDYRSTGVGVLIASAIRRALAGEMKPTHEEIAALAVGAAAASSMKPTEMEPEVSPSQGPLLGEQASAGGGSLPQQSPVPAASGASVSEAERLAIRTAEWRVMDSAIVVVERRADLARRGEEWFGGIERNQHNLIAALNVLGDAVSTLLAARGEMP
jgi:hypothetical protein